MGGILARSTCQCLRGTAWWDKALERCADHLRLLRHRDKDGALYVPDVQAACLVAFKPPASDKSALRTS